jgi:hypothetical protein
LCQVQSSVINFEKQQLLLKQPRLIDPAVLAAYQGNATFDGRLSRMAEGSCSESIGTGFE